MGNIWEIYGKYMGNMVNYGNIYGDLWEIPSGEMRYLVFMAAMVGAYNSNFTRTYGRYRPLAS